MCRQISKELYKDNKKSGKARGANGKPRKRDQIIAIALNTAGKSKSRGKHLMTDGGMMKA